MALFNDTRYNVQWQMNDRGPWHNFPGEYITIGDAQNSDAIKAAKYRDWAWQIIATGGAVVMTSSKAEEKMTKQKLLDRLVAIAVQLVQSARVRAEPWPDGARLTVDWAGLDTVHFRIDATYLEDSIDNLRDYLKARFHAAVTERAADRRGSAPIRKIGTCEHDADGVY